MKRMIPYVIVDILGAVLCGAVGGVAFYRGERSMVFVALIGVACWFTSLVLDVRRFRR